MYVFLFTVVCDLCYSFAGNDFPKINRVENKALSAERMGCCLFDEGLNCSRFYFRIRCMYCVAALKGDARK